MMKHAFRALVGASLLCVVLTPPASAQTCASPAAEAAPKPKKKGFGLGGLLRAAKNAGVGDMLGAGNLLGDGKVGQVVGAVAGTAMSSGGGGASGGQGLGALGGMGGLGNLVGSGRAAQVAGAVTGTVAELARSGGQGAGGQGSGGQGAARPCTPAPAASAAPTTTSWN